MDTIVQRVTIGVISNLRGDDSLDFSNKLTTSRLANELGCCPSTIRRRWGEWGLQLLSKTRHGEMVFSGASVRRYLAQLNKLQQK